MRIKNKSFEGEESHRLEGKTTFIKLFNSYLSWENCIIMAVNKRYMKADLWNMDHDKFWIRKFWIEGVMDIESIAVPLMMPIEIINSLMASMGLSFSAPKCSICKYRDHNRSNCIYVIR